MKNEISVLNQDGVLLVSSRVVADDFGKRHEQVLRRIEEKLLNTKLCSANWFIESTYKDSTGRELKEYLMTRDGFSFIVMGFTGVKADEFKIKYIEAFNQMEKSLKEQPKQKIETTQDVKLMNAKARLENAKTRKASLYLKLAEVDTLSKEYKNILVNKATEELSGEKLLPYTKSEQKTYSATDLGKMFGVSKQKIGRVTNEHNLKTDAYGEWYRDKSGSSSKEVDSFRYFDTVIPALERIFNRQIA